MKVLPVANGMVVLTVMIATVSTSRPDTGRPVAPRHAIAPAIQVRAAIIAAATPASGSVEVNRTDGATTAVARLIATRFTMSGRWGGSIGAAVTWARGASRVTVTMSGPSSARTGRMVDGAVIVGRRTCRDPRFSPIAPQEGPKGPLSRAGPRDASPCDA